MNLILTVDRILNTQGGQFLENPGKSWKILEKKYGPGKSCENRNNLSQSWKVLEKWIIFIRVNELQPIQSNQFTFKNVMMAFLHFLNPLLSFLSYNWHICLSIERIIDANQKNFEENKHSYIWWRLFIQFLSWKKMNLSWKNVVF